MNQKRKDKFADFLLDIVKYIITAVLLATWFSGVEQWSWDSYYLIITSLVLVTTYGLYLYDDEKEKNGKNGNIEKDISKEKKPNKKNRKK